MGPITLAALRFFLAFLVLLPFLCVKRGSLRGLTVRLWSRMFLLGVSAYTVGNAVGFWGLQYLQASSAAFLMSFSPLLILVASAIWLKETPTRLQFIGASILFVGTGLFFSSGFETTEILGVILVAVGLVSLVFFWILGRGVAKEKLVDPLTLTALPLGLGGGLLVAIAIPLEGVPILPAEAWGIVFLMAIVSTALGFMLYNHALQTLTALEMNVVISLFPIVTAALAWFFLEERLTHIQMVGMAIAFGGVALVHWKKMVKKSIS